MSQAYFDVLAAQDTLAFVRAQKAAVAEQLASAKRNFEVGTSTITDTREAQARYDLVVAQEIAAENDLRVKKLALDTLVGKHRREAQSAGGAGGRLPSPQPHRRERLGRSRARTTAPPSSRPGRRWRSPQLETEKAKAGHKPTLDLTASYNVTRNPQRQPATQPLLTAQQHGHRRRGVQPAAVRRLRHRRTASAKRCRWKKRPRPTWKRTRRTVAQAMRTAFFGVVSGQGQVKALEAAEASSQSALDANRLGYQVGVRINIDVLNSQSQLFQTKRDLALARYNVLLGHLRLRQANGTLAPEDLTRLNTLLAK